MARIRHPNNCSISDLKANHDSLELDRMDTSLWDRYWTMTEVDDSTGCRLWTGSRVNKPDGTKTYGKIEIDGKFVYAHRMAWALYRGFIPAGMCICHKCDNPQCCNIDHLFMGTKKENSQDSVRKGRMHSGETSGRSKLTDAKVKVIRQTYEEKADKVGIVKALALLFDVTRVTIYRVINRETWNHIDVEPSTVKFNAGKYYKAADDGLKGIDVHIVKDLDNQAAPEDRVYFYTKAPCREPSRFIINGKEKSRGEINRG